MKFSDIPIGFATKFRFFLNTDDVRFKVIFKDLYEFLIISNFENMKVNVQHFLEVNQSNFIVLYYNCMNDIISK